MEALSAKLDTFAREDILAAQDELLNPAQPVAEGVLLSAETNEELSGVKTRIMEIARVLGDFKNLREEGVKRKEYMDRLVQDIAGYYSYNTFLARKFLEMFSVAEVRISLFLANNRRLNFSKRTRFHDPFSFVQILSKQHEENSSMLSLQEESISDLQENGLTSVSKSLNLQSQSVQLQNISQVTISSNPPRHFYLSLPSILSQRNEF
jgi:hypothetical protein